MARQRASESGNSYVRLLEQAVRKGQQDMVEMLLSSGVYHGIATHDPKMIDATIDFTQREGIGKDAFEFQMLYGIRRDLQEQLARDGYGMRVYVPYGKHWYPYFMRRLAERPANIWFVLKNLWK